MPFIPHEHSDSDIFTTESSVDEGGHLDDGCLYTDEELVVAKELPYHPCSSHSDPSDEYEILDRSAVLARKLTHFPPDIVQQFNDMLHDMGICAWSFRDLQAVNVTVHHEFDLTYKTPVYQNTRRVDPRHYENVREEIEKMLQPGIIRPSKSSCFSRW